MYSVLIMSLFVSISFSDKILRFLNVTIILNNIAVTMMYYNKYYEEYLADDYATKYENFIILQNNIINYIPHLLNLKIYIFRIKKDSLG